MWKGLIRAEGLLVGLEEGHFNLEGPLVGLIGAHGRKAPPGTGAEPARPRFAQPTRIGAHPVKHLAGHADHRVGTSRPTLEAQVAHEMKERRSARRRHNRARCAGHWSVTVAGSSSMTLE